MCSDWNAATGADLRPATVLQRNREIEKDLRPRFKDRPISKIMRLELTTALKEVEARAPEVARNLRNDLRGAPISSVYLEMRVAKYADGEKVIIPDIDVARVLRELWGHQLASMQDPMGCSGYIQACKTEAQRADGRHRRGGLLFVATLDGATDQVGQAACWRRPDASISQHRVAEERSPGTMPERGGKEFMRVAAFDRTAGTRVEGLLRKVREFFQGHGSSFGVPRRIGSDARVEVPDDEAMKGDR